MAKKSRRGKKRKRQPRLSASQLVQPSADKAKRTVVSKAQETGKTKTERLNEEYQYVVADLKRIGILATAMLVLLIVLAVALT